MSNNIQIDITATDKASDKLKRVAQALREMDDKIGDASKGMGSATNSMNGLVMAAGQFVGGLAIGDMLLRGAQASVQLSMGMEQTKIAFENFLGSADRANAYLAELREFSEVTPFQFSDLTEASQRLMSMGFAAESVVPMLRDIGDAMAGMGRGAGDIQGVTLALGQMQLKGKLSAEEMMQLSERGVAGWRYVAQSLGVTTGEAQKLAEKGLIPVDEAIKAILAGMRQDFGGQMARQSETAAGRLSTLQDKIESLGLKIGDMLLPAFSRLIEAGFGLVDMTGAAATAFDQLARMAGVNAVNMLDAVGALDEYEAQARRVAVVNGDVAASYFGSTAATQDANVERLRSMRLIVGETTSYQEFLSTMDRLTPVQREHLRTLGYINEELYNQAIAARDSAGAVTAAAMTAWRDGERAQYDMAGATSETNAALEEQRMKAEEQRQGVMLQAGLAGTLTNAQREYKAVLDELAAKEKELATNSKLTSTERQQLNTEIQNLRDKAGEAATSLRSVTNELIYQQASAGLSAEASLNLARSLGLISEQDYAVSAAIQNQKRLLDDGKISQEEYTRRVKEIATAISQLQSKGIVVTVENINIQRNININEERRQNTSNRPEARSIGGPVVAGQTYMVGERGPELFTPATSGRIVPNGNTSTTNDIVINVYGATDPASVATEVKRQLQDVANQAANQRR